MRALLNQRRYLIGGCHAALIAAAVFIAFNLRFDFSVPGDSVTLLHLSVVIALLVKMPVFWLIRLDRGWWRYASVSDLVSVALGNVAASIVLTGVLFATFGLDYPKSIYVLDFVVCFLACAGARFAVRVYNETFVADTSHKSKGVLVYGAGVAGMTMVREMRANPAFDYEIVGFLDDNPRKNGATILGIPILGRGREAVKVVEAQRRNGRSVDEIIIAMPSATGHQMGEALAYCRAAGVPCKTVPNIGEILSGKILTTQIRDIAVTDLLGRDPVRLEEERIRRKVTGRIVLVTGAAGSIGSELCRQIAQYHPTKLIALDQAESELFKIDHELRAKFPELELLSEIADIRDYQRIDEILRVHSVESIFHAAAYKHVPMMEVQPLEAAKNNILGTWNVVQAAHRNAVSDFLMISSDKAVNPTNVMGATKRAAELLISSMAHVGPGGTKYVSVRFGNVLGSNGSVVPLFKQQIATGGPVTVTHPEVRRYFMTTREAVQLVLQASTMGRGNETFVLDMGEPVRIVDLANNMIRLAGLVPDKDIEIRFVGLRPGEKLYEELITEGEDILPTYHEKIKIFRGPSADPAMIETWLLELEAIILNRDELGFIEHLKRLIPEYQPEDRWKIKDKAKPRARAARQVTRPAYL
jgi:FlaA1/EpsC-like NDP-sugar epimerase